MTITIEKASGVVVWGEYTVRPGTTDADFQRLVESIEPSQGEKAHPEPTHDPVQPEQRGFLKRLFSGAKQPRPEETERSYALPQVAVDEIPATGRLIFKGGVVRRLDIAFEMPGRSEIERLRAYNRFLQAQFGLTRSVVADALDKPAQFHYSWGITRSYFEPDPKTGVAACEVQYKDPAAPERYRTSADATPPEIIAIVEAQQAAAQMPGDAARRLRLRQLLSQATGVPHDDLSAWTGAGFAFTRGATRRFEFLTRMSNFLGVSLEKKKFPDALAAASVMLMLEPDDHALYAERAEAYLGLKDYDVAIQGFTEALQRAPTQSAIAPDDPTARYRQNWTADYLRRRGYARRLKDDLAGAVDDYTQSLSIHQAAETLRMRGVAYMHRLDFQKAITDFEAGNGLNPADLSHRINRGLCHAYLGDLDSALADLSFVIEKLPDNPLILAEVAWVHSRRKAHEEAQRYADRAIQLETQNGVAYYSRGAARAALGDPAGALADFQIALERWPEARSPLYAKEAKEMDDFIAAHTSESKGESPAQSGESEPPPA